MDGFINIYFGFILFLIAAFVLMVLFYFVAGVVILIPFYVIGMVVSIFYYKMGKNAGCKNAWIAFLPFGKNYLAFALPHREYNIGLIKTKRRKRVFWTSAVMDFITYSVMGLYAAALFAYAKLAFNYDAAQYGLEPGAPSTFYILLIVFLLVGGVVFILRSIVHWRKNYDLLKTYQYDQFAVWGALLNIICPLVMVIMPMIMAGRAPEYGLKNYYSWKEKETRHI